MARVYRFQNIIWEETFNEGYSMTIDIPGKETQLIRKRHRKTRKQLTRS
jgi:hypothetical protein